MILVVPRKTFRVCFLNSRPFFAGTLFFCLLSTSLWNKALGNYGFLGNDLIPFAGFTLSDSVSNYNGSHVSCKGSSDGSIDLTVTGGVSPFTYSWSDGSTLEDLAGLTAGVYQVFVTDSIGDLDSLTVILTEPDEILVDFSAIHPICNNSNGSITALVSGGTGNYQYSWSNGFTIQTISGLGPGTYTITVTDTNGCSMDRDTILFQAGLPQPILDNLIHVTCFGNSAGAIDISISGGTAPFTFSWSSGSTNEDIGGIPAGSYTVSVTDQNGCTGSGLFQVTQPDSLFVDLIGTDETCTGSNGQISSLITGGTGPYGFLWSNGSTLNQLIGLQAGVYFITVTDSNNCIATDTLTLLNYPEPQVSLGLVTNVSCFAGSDGTVSIDVTGGGAPYTFQWSGGETTEDLSAVAAGNYTVTVTDTNSCVIVVNASVTEPLQLSLIPAFVSSTCGNANGTASVAVTGGTGSYNFLWSDGSTSNPAIALLAGSYTVTVTDSNFCTASSVVVVNDIPAPVPFTDSLTMVSCNGGSDGAMDITVNSGTPPFAFIWSDGSTSEDLSAVPAGTYTVLITDAGNCTATLSATVNEPQPISVSFATNNATCGLPNGSSSATGTGGSGPLSYVWSVGTTGNTINNVPAGSYTVTVTDSASCSVSAITSVNNIGGPVVNIGSITNVSCNGQATGAIDINVLNGTPPYQFVWSNGATTEDLISLAAGIYQVTVTDSNLCVAGKNIIVSESAALFINLFPQDETCGLSNGSITAIAGGGAGALSYLWSQGDTLPAITGIPAGSYMVTVTDGNSCTATAAAALVNFSGPSLNIQNINPVSCHSGNNGSVSVTASGGTAPLSWLWSNGSTVKNQSGLLSGTYTVTVTDANSCTYSLTAVVSQPAAISASLSSVPETCNLQNGSVSCLASGGTGNLSFLWSDASTTTTINSLSGGYYTITITDSNACSITDSVYVDDLEAPILSILPGAPILCHGNATGTLNLGITSGNGPFQFSWSDGSTSEDPVNLIAGSYTVTVTDINSCTATTSALITEPLALQLSASAVNANCNTANGSVQAAGSGGTGSLGYLWSNGSTGLALSSLPSGTYTVTVTDDNGCSLQDTAIVGLTAGLSATATSSGSVTCFGGSDGFIDLTVNGGNQPFQFLWSNGSTTEDLAGIPTGIYTVTVTDQDNCTTVSGEFIPESTQITSSFNIQNSLSGNPTGSILATPAGGSGGYSFLWSNSATVNFISGLVAGTYTCTITDQSACSRIFSPVVSILTSACGVSVTSFSDVTCNGDNDGSADITVTGGIPPFTYLWSNGATTEDLLGLPAGAYTVTVTDSVLCIATTSVTISEPAILAVSISSTNGSCGNSNGTATANPTGGNGGNSYSWSNGSTTASISGLGSGTFTVSVTDSKGCSSTSSVSMTVATAPQVTSGSVVNVSCNGGNDGSINITVSNGSPPYTYTWSNGSTVQDLTTLLAGSYTVTVTDSAGCQVSANYSVTQPNALSVNLNTVSTTCGNSNGIVSTNVTGGTGPFSYLWNTGATTANLTGVTASTYTVTVTDDAGCTVTSTAILQNIAGPAVSVTTQVNVTCNNGNNGSINITVTSGTAPYTYLWSNGSSTEDISSLTDAVYTVTVTDANSCTATVSATITEPAAVGAVITPVNPTCGNPNGSASVAASGGTGGYTYSWSTGSTSISVSALLPGTYTVTVTDASGCTKTATTALVNISGPSVTVTAVDSVSCNGGGDGSITITVTGGTAPYTYSWSNGTTIEDASGLSSGTFTVTVTDANGCTVTSSSTVLQPAALTVSMNKTNATCGNPNGSITATPSGGTGSYSYLWSNSNTNAGISGLAPAVYTVTVTDNNGCTKTATSQIVNIAGPSVVLNVLTNSSCNGGTNGAVNITVSSGTTPYTYSWSNGATTEDISGLPAGSYTVTVTDANSCTATLSATVTQPSAISITTSHVDATCGSSNGSATASASGGTGSFTYLWSTGATTSAISGLAVNIYVVTATDANGCTGSASVSIGNAGAPAIVFNSISNVTCNGGTNGSVSISVTGGTSPYTYSWSNGATTQDLTGVSSGNYTLILTDSNNCSTTFDTLVTQPSVIAISISKTNASCGNANGSMTASATGGTGSFGFLWSNGTTTATTTGLSPGTYTVTATDGNGCTRTGTASISNVSGPTVNITSTTNVSCSGGSDGAINITVTGGTTPYTYLWTTAATSQDISAIPSGTYTVTVTDANGCTATKSATVTQPSVITAGTGTVNATCLQANGTATVTASGGTGGYLYLWSNGQTTLTSTGLSASTYTVTVTDANGCTKTATAQVTDAGLPVVTLNTLTSPGCNGASTGSITLTVTGGTSPYTYIWSNGKTTKNNTNIPAGTYTLTVTDASGCTMLYDTTVTEPTVISMSFSNNNAACGGNNGVSTVTLSGGTPGYTLLWSNGKTTNTITGLGAGNYTVTVTDNNGCTRTASTSITNSTNPGVVPVSITNVTCFGGSNGAINISITGGTSPFTYLWSNAATSQDVTGLTAGTYTVTVTDSVGCVAVFSTPVSQPNQITLSLTDSSASCGFSNGYASVTASGGTGTLTYNWSNGVTTASNPGILGGTYTVTVTDANGCTRTGSATVANSNAPTITLFNLNPANCFGGSSGDINITVTSGASPYTYTWSNGKTTQDNFNTPSGTYTVTVTDQNGCTATASYFVNQPAQIVITETMTPANCGNSNGGISLSVSGGFQPYTYSWSTGSLTDTLTGRPAGNYTILVTDSNGCTKSKVITIGSIGGPVITTDSLSDISCLGGSDGYIVNTITAGVPPYQFAWSNGATVEDLTALPAGTYTVTVTDSAGCITLKTFTLTEPTAINILILATNPTCGLSNGSVLLSNVTGGAGPYQFDWSNGSTTTGISNLLPGIFTLTVTDSRNCTADTTVTLTDPGNPVITLDSIRNVKCNGGLTGKIFISVNGGYTNYTYSWSNGSSVQDAANLAAGIYTIMVYDSVGCGDTAVFTVTQAAAINLVLNATDATCGFNNGTVTSLVTGGSPGFDYLWSNGVTLATVNNLAPGVYTLTVTDSLGCSASDSDTVLNAPGPVMNSIQATAVTCFGQANGSIAITVSGGTPPLTYTWSNGSSSQNLSGLSGSTYTVTVTDNNGCTTTGSATVTEPAQLTAQVSTTPSSCGSANGTATVITSGGNGGNSYLWSNGQTVSSINTLLSGTYTVTVTDNKGCTRTATGIVAGTNAPVANVQSVVPVSCNGLSNGSINITVSGGNSPYTYSWSNGSTTEDISLLLPGTYTVTVTDANGCTDILSATVTQPAILALSLATTLSSCTASDGTASVTAGGGTPSYSFLWSTGATTDSIGGLAAGSYTVTVTDLNGCTKDTIAVISNPSAPAVSINVVKNITCFGGTDGFIEINVAGGTGPYLYIWSNGETTEDIQNLAAGPYTVTVTDQFGCTTVFSQSLSEPTDIQISITTVDATCGSANGSACISISGGVSPYTFIWSNGQTILCIQNLTAGSYPVTVTDNNGCLKIDAANISNLAGPEIIVADSANTKCFNGTDGSVNISVSAGNPPYSFSWSNGSTTEDISGLAAGTYTVTVTDNIGCLALYSVTLIQPSAITRFAVSPFMNDTFNVSCYGLNDGSLDLTVSGGTPPYSYSWSDLSTTEDISNLSAGTYTVTITDNNGCSVQSAFLLTEPGPLNANAGSNFTICGLDSTNLAADSLIPGTSGFWQVVSGTGFLADSTSPFSFVSNLSNGSVVLNWIVTDGICLDTSSITISVATEVKAIAGIDLTTCEDTAFLTATPTSFGYGFWSNITGSGFINDTLDPTTKVSELSQGINTFQWIVVNGNCTDTDYVSIEVLDPDGCLSDVQMPSGISPNSDGKNDYFVIRGLEDYPFNTLSIYNRWGNLVYEKKNYDNRWKGTSDDGKILPEGTYFVILKVDNYPILIKGFVDLRR